jgi:hypothetical protein
MDEKVIDGVLDMLKGTPKPAGTLPGTDEPYWDAAQVRALMDRLTTAQKDAMVLNVLASHVYDLDVKWRKSPNKIERLKLDIRATTRSGSRGELDRIRAAAEDISLLSSMENLA